MNDRKSAIGIFEEFADEYLNFEKTPKKNILWLDTMEFLCRRFSNPQNSCPSFHVAGSKGKGSISKMIACILEEAGYFTGIFSSPHIVNFNERIGSIRGPFDEEIYEKSVKSLIEKINSIKSEELPGKRPVTWFELVTLLGMLCFKNARTDYAVYEVGLGGRLDSTNVINPICSCISQIELEHTEFLGDTVEKIAAEKGGIIKPNIPVIISKQISSVKNVFKNIADEKKAPVFFSDEISTLSDVVYNNRQLVSNNSYYVDKFRQKGLKMNFKINSQLFKRPLNISLSLLGKFQAQNASVAAIAVKTVIPDITEGIIEKGLSKAVLPGRFEPVFLENTEFKNIQALILDGAHTVNSIGYTLDTFASVFPMYTETESYLLFACAADKDAEHIAQLFKNKFNHVILTVPGNTKESDLPRLKSAFDNSKIDYISTHDYLKAISYTLERAEENKGIVLVTGSFYLVSEVKKYLIAKKASHGL